MALATPGRIALPPPTARHLYQSSSSSLCLPSLLTLHPRSSSLQRRARFYSRHSAVLIRAGAAGLARVTSRFARIRCVCKAGRSDITSELELERAGKQPVRRANGVFWVILLNLAIYVADHFFQLPIIKALYLYHARPDWFQFVTATFCHFNWKHLSSNLFFLYIFGKLVEEEEGTLGLWISYMVTGAGANLVSWLVLPSSAVSVGASGAVFGLFAVCVLVKMSWDWRKILEVLILGQFVIERVLEAARASTGMVVGRGSSMMNVNHIAHLSGALIGAGLIHLVSRVPSQSSGKDMTSRRAR